jgi:penicillin amidase
MRIQHLFFASSALVMAALSGLQACSSSSSPASAEDSGVKDTGVRKDAPVAKDAPVKDAPATDGGAGMDSAIDGIPVTQKLTASMLSAPVNVVRDQYGIPHIYGQDLADVAYAEGYVMASDRLVEMDLGRREAEGTLTELVGTLDPSILATDIGMRMQNIKGTATTTWMELQASTAPRDQAIAKAVTYYAAGINAFVADLNAGKAPPLPPGSIYSSANFTPWTEVDSFALAYLQAFELVYDSDTEILYTEMQTAEKASFDGSSNPALAARAGIAKDFEILTPQDPTFILPSGWTGFGGDTSEARAPRPVKKAKKPLGKTSKSALASLPKAPSERAAETKEMLALLQGSAKTVRGLGVDRSVYQTRGSNNFILGPSLTADNHVIIGNDTHLSLSNPPIFYLVQIVATGGTIPVNATGVNFPGIPGIVLGNNEHIAWAATDNYIDVTDVYQETLVDCTTSAPFAGTGTPCVVFNGMNVPTTPRPEVFKIGLSGNIGSMVTETFYDVLPQHGPIIPQLDANYNVLPLGSTALSVKYTGYTPAQLLRGLVGVFTATTMQEAVTALDNDFLVGGENWLIGDDQGNFGWTQVCSVPRRAAGHAPWLVLPGDGTAEWGASMDRHYIPHAYNPSVGFIASANNDPIGVTAMNDPFFSQPVVGSSPLYLGFNYDPGTRAGRMTKVIQADITAGHKFTQDDVAVIQGDIVSEWGQALAPTFLSVASDLAAEIAASADGGFPDGATDPHPELAAIVAAADPTAKGLVQKAHDIMAAWTDYETPSGVGTETSAQQIADSQAALLNGVFYPQFAHLTFDDEITALGVTPVDDALRKLLVRMCTNPSSLATGLSSSGDNILFDNLTTPAVESKEQIAAQAIINTLDYIVKTLGADPSGWAWGDIHTLTLPYLLPVPSLSLPPANDMTYPNGYPRHGDDGTVDVGAHGLSLSDYSYDLGPAIRFGADLNPAGITAQNALPGGETFNPTSPHYQDQLMYWLKGAPFPLSETLAAVAASAQVEYSTNKDGRIQFTP